MNDPILPFLVTLAENAPADFREMLTNIAESYELYGTLSQKMRLQVRRNANIQKVAVPPEFETMKAERDAIDASKAAPELFEAMEAEQTAAMAEEFCKAMHDAVSELYDETDANETLIEIKCIKHALSEFAENMADAFHGLKARLRQ